MYVHVADLGTFLEMFPSTSYLPAGTLPPRSAPCILHLLPSHRNTWSTTHTTKPALQGSCRCGFRSSHLCGKHFYPQGHLCSPQISVAKNSQFIECKTDVDTSERKSSEPALHYSAVNMCNYRSARPPCFLLTKTGDQSIMNEDKQNE